MIIFYTILLTILWIFPTFIAFVRAHKNAIPIALLNIFLSFTLIGYVVSLIWSFSDNTKNTSNVPLKDWQLLLIYIILLTITSIVFMKMLDFTAEPVARFIKVYQLYY
jgi:hypothetical protein